MDGATLLRQLAAEAPSGWRVLLELGLPLGSDGRVPDLTVVIGSRPTRSWRTAART